MKSVLAGHFLIWSGASVAALGWHSCFLTTDQSLLLSQRPVSGPSLSASPHPAAWWRPHSSALPPSNTSDPFSVNCQGTAWLWKDLLSKLGQSSPKGMAVHEEISGSRLTGLRRPCSEDWPSEIRRASSWKEPQSSRSFPGTWSYKERSATAVRRTPCSKPAMLVTWFHISSLQSNEM